MITTINITRYLKLFLITYPLFVIIDFTWFGFIITDLYLTNIGHLMRTAEGFTLGMLLASLGALALIVLGAIIFVTPHVESASYTESFLWGALYSLGTYGVFALSNYAHFRGWPLFLSAIDICWGILINGLLAVFLSYLTKKVIR